MSVVNLNSARKAQAKAAARVKAGENAAKYGQTKAKRELGKARTAKAASDLDGHRRDRD